VVVFFEVLQVALLRLARDWSGTDTGATDILVNKLSAGNLRAALVALARLRINDPAVLAEVEAFLGDVEKAEVDRNMVAHSFWCRFGTDSAAAIRYQLSSAPGFKITDPKFTAPQLREISIRTETLIERAGELQRSLWGPRFGIRPQRQTTLHAAAASAERRPRKQPPKNGRKT